MVENALDKERSRSKSRILFGTIILIVGFVSPVFIPVVLASGLGAGLKSVLTGLLAFGIPELFMLIAIVIMGKPGYNFIKGKLFAYLKPLAPPDRVSRTRYNIGLVLFSTPLIVGLIYPYLEFFLPELSTGPISVHIASDLILIISFFVLGGDFWDKVSGLFNYNIKAKRSFDR